MEAGLLTPGQDLSEVLLSGPYPWRGAGASRAPGFHGIPLFGEQLLGLPSRRPQAPPALPTYYSVPEARSKRQVKRRSYLDGSLKNFLNASYLFKHALFSDYRNCMENIPETRMKTKDLKSL